MKEWAGEGVQGERTTLREGSWIKIVWYIKWMSKPNERRSNLIFEMFLSIKIPKETHQKNKQKNGYGKRNEKHHQPNKRVIWNSREEGWGRDENIKSDGDGNPCPKTTNGTRSPVAFTDTKGRHAERTQPPPRVKGRGPNRTITYQTVYSVREEWSLSLEPLSSPHHNRTQTPKPGRQRNIQSEKQPRPEIFLLY